MKSRTSSCNMRVFKKDITRFAPIWVEYSVLLLIIFYFLWNANGDITDKEQFFLSVQSNLLNAVYGFICAACLFGYLSDPKECNTVHTFPIRREEYYIIHLTAGFLMALVPNFLFCMMNIPLVSGNVLMTFAGMMLQFTFYYGLAVFCMFLTGRRFAAATLYALFNWISILLMWAVETIYLPMLPGIALNTEAFYDFCPVVKFMQTEPSFLGMSNAIPGDMMTVFVSYAAAGLILMVLSLLLYRKRRLEYAGDFIAVKWLTPVFIVALSLAFGCALAAFSELFEDQAPYIMLGIGLVTGFFTGMMLLKRTVKVFSLKSIIGAAALLGAVFGSLFITRMDLFDRVNYVPEPEDVASICISHYNDADPYYESTDPSVIADVVDLHGDVLAVENFADRYDYTDQFYLSYKLKNGQTVFRCYRVKDTKLLPRIRFYHSQPEAMLGVSTLEQLQNKCRYIYIESYSADGSYQDMAYTDTLTKQQQNALLEVLFRECKEGKMSGYTHTDERNVYISIETSDELDLWIDVPETAVDTLALCEELVAQEQNVLG